MTWIRANRMMAALIVLCLATVVVGGMMLYTSWQARQTANTRAELSKNQTGAALESGKDAAETVGNSAAVEAGSERLGRDNADTISKAEGANAKVADPVRNAGRSALCKRAAYRDTLGCKAERP